MDVQVHGKHPQPGTAARMKTGSRERDSLSLHCSAPKEGCGGVLAKFLERGEHGGLKNERGGMSATGMSGADELGPGWVSRRRLVELAVRCDAVSWTRSIRGKKRAWCVL
jgi:hypothetical protein